MTPVLESERKAGLITVASPPVDENLATPPELRQTNIRLQVRSPGGI